MPPESAPGSHASSSRSSSFDSFHSAVSSPARNVQPQPLSPPPPSPLPPSPLPSPPPAQRLASKLAPSRTLRFFQKVSSSSPAASSDIATVAETPPSRRPPPLPPASPRTTSKRPRHGVDRTPRIRLSRAHPPEAAARPIPRNVSDRSSQESTSSTLLHPSRTSPAFIPRHDETQTPEMSPLADSRLTITPVPSIQGSLHPPASPTPTTPATVAADDQVSVDDWGIDELSDDDVATEAATFQRSARDGDSLDSAAVAGVNFDRMAPISSVRSAESSKDVSHRDTITLRAFDENIDQQAKLVASDLARVNNVIGIYADPAAEADDWGDDFDLEQSSSKPGDGSSGSRAADEGPSSFPAWFIEKDPEKNEFKFKVEISEAPPPISAMRNQYHPATAEILPGGDDTLRMRSVPPSSFSSPTLTHSSLLSFPGVGYQASAVHPSCTRVKELFSRYDATIRRHFDALVRDSGGTIALDRKTRSVYQLSMDPDVSKLAKANKDLSADVLMWKLEWAMLNNNAIDHAKLLLGLSNICKDAGNFKEATRLVKEAIKALAEIEDSNLSLAIAIELEYELAVLHRALGALGESEKALKRAMAQSGVLAARSEDTDDLLGPQQRGLWWQLRCKFLLAEILYDRKNLDAAVQFFSEYIVEGITRMIGLIAPPRAEDSTLGTEFMRYCLFSPRRLVLAMWTTVISLGDMKCFARAADTAALTSLVASSFGYEDANKAGFNVRLKIKDIAVDLRRQYDEISRTILRSSNPAAEDLRILPGGSEILSSQFEYNVGDFGDMGDDVVEDWDAQLERELNIKIERCCELEQSNETSSQGTDGNTAPSPLTNEAFTAPFLEEAGVHSKQGLAGKSAGNGESRKGQQTSCRWQASPHYGNLIEAELRQYLGRVGGAASTLSAQQMFPKPTQPFDGRLMGPREHENFLRRFVRSKDPILSRRILRGLPVTALWYPSVVCKLNLVNDSIEDIDFLGMKRAVLSPNWGVKLLDVLWKIVRADIDIQQKRSRVRQLILHSFSKVSTASKRTPVHDGTDRQDRLDMLASLLDSLRLAREILSESGSDAVWFSRACMFLGRAAATVTPAAKAAVELFQAESRAHCGVKAVVSGLLLKRCASAERERLAQQREDFRTDKNRQPATMAKRSPIPTALQQSIVDVMHALYWRTKAGFDESSDADSLERLIHAEVASGLFLTGCGLSPVDGSFIDVVAETKLLNISEMKRSKSDDPNTLVDETRRVSASELIQELQSLWLSLPSSAGLIRAKVSFALAHHSRIDQRDFARAERFLFDGLRSVHAASANQHHPHSFFSRLLHVSPVAIVSSPLAEAILHSYGTLAVSHSKYRYGIAALEASTDARRVRTMNKHSYQSSVMTVVEAAVKNNDWRRALALLYSLRALVHPKDGRRNEFLRLSLKLHRICFDVGCFEASIVPLRAYSALIYEERLRVLLQRYRRRLTKKAKSRIRRRLPGPPLPKLLPGGSVFPNGKNSLASFFEAPIVSSALDNTIRQSATLFEMRPRSTTAMVPLSTAESGNSAFRKLVAFLWPVPVKPRRSSSQPSPSVTTKTHIQVIPTTSAEHSKSKEPIRSPPRIPARQHDVVESSQHADAGRFDEEQRELLRIEAEQEIAADSDRFRVEFLRAQTEYSQADFTGAELRCRGLLEMRIPHAGRYKVLEILARIRLKRREVTRCLELIDQMEQAYVEAEAAKDPPNEMQSTPSEEIQRVSIFRLHDQAPQAKNDEKPQVFMPQVTFIRLSALIHGGRLNEALYLADKSIEACAEHSFWDLGRLHYLRGKALAAMSSTSTAPFQRENEREKGSRESEHLILKVTELTLAAFETASRYYDAAGDEVCTAKADLLWSRTSIDFLFRKVVLKKSCGGGIPIDTACIILNRRIVVEEVVDVIYSVINLATTANLPILLIDAMAALAEVKCIQRYPSSTWRLWVSEAWKLFSRLFTDAENFTVVLDELAPVSTLFRLRNLCGRLVRLVMCDEHDVNVSDMNKHLRLFEAYVTLQISIDRKMNLSSSAHRTSSASPISQEGMKEPVNMFSGDEARPSVASASPSARSARTDKKTGIGPSSFMRRKFPKAQSSDRRGESSVNDVISDSMSDTTSEKSAPPRRPAGAFLHILGDEGVALGRQGFSVFINRPRQQVISAVKGTGAVLIPTNFFTNSKAAPGHELGRDAEMIFPFKSSVGLGAMQILDETKGDIDERIELIQENPVEHRTVSEDMRGTETVVSGQTNEMNRQVSSESVSDEKTDVDGEVGKRRGTEDYETERQSTEVERDRGNLEGNETPQAAAFESNDKPKSSKRNELAKLLKAIRDELEGGHIQTKGSSRIFGETTAERVWSHMHRIKTETKKYMHGEITLEQLHDRNNDALLGWVHCIPLSRKEWTVPESIGRRLVYILYAHGIVGYYAVDRGGSIESIAFGGKQNAMDTDVMNGSSSLRSPTRAERLYLSELVKGFQRDEVWHKNRDSEIVNGMANRVLRAPRLLLSSSSPAQKSRSRPIVMIADLPLQILPWELFFDHVVIRSHCLLDVIRGMQDEASQSQSSLLGVDDPAVAASRKIARFISFGPSRREILDLERTEEARRQQLAFQGLLRLNQMNPASIIAFLGLGGFSDPTALNAVSRPTGPLSSPLSQSRKAVKLFGLRISANIGRRNYPHMDFLKVSGLGSATTWDLKEAAMVLQPAFNDKDEPKRDLGAYVPVFMFSYADLVDSSDSVFGLRRLVPEGILMFTPAIHMKVLAKHLEDDELSAELGRASGRIHNRIFPDVIASARVLVEYVSRFSREKRIPIVVFLGQGLVDVFPRKRGVKTQPGLKPAPAAERFVQLHGGGRVFSAQ